MIIVSNIMDEVGLNFTDSSSSPLISYIYHIFHICTNIVIESVRSE